MSGLDMMLTGEFDTPQARLALELAREDQQLLAALIEARKLAGMTQADVADALGLSQATISAFERLGNDPRLSTVRRYARVVGAMIRHHVERDEGRGCGDSQYLAHVTAEGVSAAATAAAIRRNLRPVGDFWTADPAEYVRRSPLRAAAR